MCYNGTGDKMKVSIGVSNRHVHLKEDDFHMLFGNDCIMENIKNLNQPGQFSSNLFVTIKTDKSCIEKVRVLGPLRDYTQVEISKTDAYKLGLNPPVRDSGDLKDSETVTIIGPKGELLAKESCIIATRHIHLTKDHMREYNLEGKKTVSVLIDGEKGGIINNVHLKVADNSYFEMHLDTDDANAK